MSYKNFKEKVWSKAIEVDLPRVCVFAENTNQKYAGTIEGIGDTVRILGVGKPTVTTEVLKDGEFTLNDAEKVEDTSVSLVVDHISHFNYTVGDIDKEQGAKGVLPVLSKETTEGIANEMDIAIANLSKEKVGVVKYAKNNTVITKDNILEVFDEIQARLFENDVNPSTPVTITLPPWMYTKFRQAYVKNDTDNSDMLKNGKVAEYANMTIKMSNNVAVNESGHHLVQVKTDRAIAFAKGKPHTEPYRPEKGFADCVKGFVLYGTKIVRPKEMITLECSAK